MCLHFRLSVMRRLPGQSTSHVVGTYVRKALKCNDDRDCSVVWCGVGHGPGCLVLFIFVIWIYILHCMSFNALFVRPS